MSILRRAIIAFALMAGLAPAIAQVPSPVPALPDTERRTSYSITGTTCICAVNFALYGDSTDYQNWVEVWLNGVNVAYNDPTFGWAITSPTGSLGSIPRPITDAILTFTSSQTGTVQIVGARRPRRATQFTENRGVAARDLNQALTDIIAQNREVWDRSSDIFGRAIKGIPGETIANLPSAALRAGTLFCWDVTGLIPSACATPSGSGNVIGPNGATSGHVAIFNGSSGTVLGDGGSIGSVNLTGDITGSGVINVTTTLATVNSNVGSFGSATQCLSVTVNGKGLITAASVNTCTPAFSSLTGQATLAQLPTIANNSILSNISGSPAVPAANGISPLFDIIGSTQGDILYRDAGGWQVLGPGSSGQLLQSGGGAANPSWVTATGTGTVTSVANDGSIKSSIASNGAITASGTLGLWGGPGDITNCTLAASVSGGALTVALKGQNGSNPSATNPCIIAFRNATLTTGDYTYLQVTAATSFSTATSGSTFGASNSTAFRLWITAWNNGGTVVLGVSKQSTSTQIFPLNEGAVQSSTACSACGTATSSGVFYTTAAQTNEAIRIIGYMDWGSGLATAGTFATGPTTIQLMGPGIKKPGEVVQTATGSKASATVSSSNTFVTSGITASITPISAANLIQGFFFADVVPTTGASAQTLTFQPTRGSTQIGGTGSASAASTEVSFATPASGAFIDQPNTTSSTSYAPFFKVNGAQNGQMPATYGNIIISEIMG